MKKSLLTLFCALCALFLFIITPHAYAATVTVGEDAASYRSTLVPFFISNGTYSSITQQIYTAEELGNTPKSISAITFYYQGAKNGSNTDPVSALSRKLEVWIMDNTKAPTDSFLMDNNGSSANYKMFKYVFAGTDNFNAKAGTKVFAGTVNIAAINQNETGSYTITFDEAYAWNGSSNIILTVLDSTKTNLGSTKLRHLIIDRDRSRYVHHAWTTSSEPDWINNLYNKYGDKYTTSSYPDTEAGQVKAHKYVNKITFTYTTPIPAPTSPSADASSTSATISWTGADGADSYEVRYGTSSGNLNNSASTDDDATSLVIEGLEPSTTYYYQIRTKIGEDHSAWTAEASFETLAHSHNSINFSKWNISTSLPTAAGNYYLTHDVTLSANWEPAANINLCLNGHTVSMGANYGLIDDGITVAIYDEEGGGKITSSNSDQTLLASGNLTYLFVYAEIENTGSGRKVKAVSGATASVDDPIDLSDASDNAAVIAENEGIIVNVEMNRSFTSSQYNTICLPFVLSAAKMAEFFGAGYDLEEFVSSSYDGEQLSLSFNKVTALEAGKPYLLKPSIDVANPSFEGVTITATSPVDQTSDTYISFRGTYAPTELAGGNRNLLFLGANNELFWPESTGNINGFRAYFEVKGEAQKAVQARILKGEEADQALDPLNANPSPLTVKTLRNGQLFILRGDKTYDILGRPVTQ